tara:strand:+ start:1178 stop:2026 length:849 start_codon:yes stop_codon:yes gene_type:complete
MGLFDGFGISDVVSLGTAAADFFGGKEANKANIASNTANVAAQGANQEKALDALGGSNDFSITKRNADGGFDNKQVGGSDAANNRAILAGPAGDKARANNLNNITNNPTNTFNSLQDAIKFNQQDSNIHNRQVTDLINRDKENLLRSMGSGNSGYQNQANSNLFELAQNYKRPNVEALDLYNKQGLADRSRDQGNLSLQQLMAPAPGFTSSNVGGTAANVIAQSPPVGVIPDLGSTVGASALGNLGRDINARTAATNAQESQNKFLTALLRQQGNQFNSPTA